MTRATMIAIIATILLSSQVRAESSVKDAVVSLGSGATAVFITKEDTKGYWAHVGEKLVYGLVNVTLSPFEVVYGPIDIVKKAEHGAMAIMSPLGVIPGAFKGGARALIGSGQIVTCLFAPDLEREVQALPIQIFEPGPSLLVSQ